MNKPKFKVWDKLRKKIFYPVELVFNSDSILDHEWEVIQRNEIKKSKSSTRKPCVMCVSIIDSLNGELLQYVEKNDKNGHELYIGDIIKHPQYLGLWELVYTPFATVGIKQIRHITNSKGQDCFGQVITIIQDWENIEYIGNKYEDVELLIGEKKKK